MRGVWRAGISMILVLTLGAMATLGCATVDRSVALSKETVTLLASGDVADVSAEELAEAMLRAGFSRNEILRHGPKIRNALATSGSAQVKDGHIVNALFAVHSN